MSDDPQDVLGGLMDQLTGMGKTEPTVIKLKDSTDVNFDKLIADHVYTILTANSISETQIQLLEALVKLTTVLER